MDGFIYKCINWSASWNFLKFYYISTLYLFVMSAHDQKSPKILLKERKKYEEDIMTIYLLNIRLNYSPTYQNIQ